MGDLFTIQVQEAQRGAGGEKVEDIIARSGNSKEK